MKLKTKSTENSHVILILELFSIGKKFESKCLFLNENHLSKMKLFDVEKFFSEILISKMSEETGFENFKKYAADQEKEFPTKLTLSPLNSIVLSDSVGGKRMHQNLRPPRERSVR